MPRFPIGSLVNGMKNNGGMCPHHTAGRTTAIVPAQKPGTVMNRMARLRAT